MSITDEIVAVVIEVDEDGYIDYHKFYTLDDAGEYVLNTNNKCFLIEGKQLQLTDHT